MQAGLRARLGSHLVETGEAGKIPLAGQKIPEARLLLQPVQSLKDHSGLPGRTMNAEKAVAFANDLDFQNILLMRSS
jgi:hypothetical protein